jgi:tetratricopeptide (TPR) repeat protein
MPIRRLSAADAFATMKANPDSDWPRRDHPANRFAHYADPSFQPRFLLEPGQRIFTIGSCFARNIEQALATRGFDIPTMAFQVDKSEWAGEAGATLNNYVPPAIAPQIRWAFGMDRFDIHRHGVELMRGRYVDLQLPNGFRPLPAEVVIARREKINEIYRTLATSHVVLITLGLIEAWFDTRSGLYLNATPPKISSRADPSRFELHVLDYNEVTASLTELTGLLDQVCPRDYRLIFTISPVPLTATFTAADVAVANTYSKSVLRAAVEPFVAAREHIEYFPSYESVTLTERSLAFADDQIHVYGPMVRFNVDRMIARYVKAEGGETVAQTIALAREDARKGMFRVGLKRLQKAWAANPEDAKLTVALADTHLRAGNGAAAERLLLAHLEKGEDGAARNVLARHYNQSGRYEEAALHAEKASELGKDRLHASLQRVIAYYHLGRYAAGLALLNRIVFALERRPTVLYWKARFSERLGRVAEAEDFYRQCTGIDEDVTFKVAFAEFLAAQDRWAEAAGVVEAILLEKPYEETALRLSAELRRRGLLARSAGLSRMDVAARWSFAVLHHALRALPFGAAARFRTTRDAD